MLMDTTSEAKIYIVSSDSPAEQQRLLLSFTQEVIVEYQCTYGCGNTVGGGGAKVYDQLS